MKYLVIVESPTKAKTIAKYLGRDYTIKPSMGHVMDLPKSKLSVDVGNKFKPDYEIIAEKKPLIAELQRLAKNAETVLLATDPDREGEAISADIKNLLSGKKGVAADKFKRIVFHEITEGAIKHALEEPRSVDTNLVAAQIARRVLDRLVGYQLSPLLWRKVRRGLSAGRVQSVALRLMVEREREIEKFQKEPYFTIHAAFLGQEKAKNTTEFELLEKNSEKIEQTQTHTLYDGIYTITKTTITTQTAADAISFDAQSKKYVVADVLKREAKRSPYPPFTTSTLQQQGAQRYGLPGKRTMSLAQKLYEEGYITYHRTDSVNLSPIAINAFRAYIEKTYGEKYLPDKPRLYFTKQKNAQEAHEAIRPTNITTLPSAVKAAMGEAYGKLYDLIWKRSLATQMADAQIESTTVYADSTDKAYRFKATGSVLLFDGFLKLTPQALEDKRLPVFTAGETLNMESIRSEPHETTPPPRYNDASLIKTLEEKSIGRPSTYASIVSTLTDRGYVERIERKFVPTAVGMAVNDFLVQHFSTVDDVPFTAQMEDDLDKVAEGQKDWQAMMADFYTPFAGKLKEVEGAQRVKIAVQTTGEVCPACKTGNLVVRTGKFGKFLSCDRFPECRFTKQFVEETNYTCPKDGGKVIVKKTRKGRTFYGCGNYPKCDFAVWKLQDIKKPKKPAKN